MEQFAKTIRFVVGGLISILLVTLIGGFILQGRSKK